MVIQESKEMYLENIYLLLQENGQVRSIDIAKKMNYSKPSISKAMKNLNKEEYINIDDNGHITLTAKGERLAKSVYEKHKILTEYLISIGISKKIAEEDACRIEHVISDETFKAIKKDLKKR